VKKIKSHWGLFLFLILTLPSFVRVFNTAGGGHFEIFREGARQLWAGTNPYDDNWHSGKWIYSPPTGYFFFSLFSYIDPKIGALLYMLASYTLFVAGAALFLRELKLSQRETGLFWVLVANEAIGAILNTRLELWITGSILMSAALLMSGSKTFLSAALLAIPTVFKIQSLAIVGLMTIHFLLARQKFLWIFSFVLVAVAISVSPALVRGIEGAILDYTQWQATLGPHLEGTYRDFQHIYRFISQVFNVDLSLANVKAIGLGVAGFFAALIVVSSRHSTKRETLYLCLVLGTCFATTFSPMSQSAGYILYAPLLAISLASPWRNYGVIGVSWLLVSGLSSDLVPRDVKLDLLPLALKSLGPLVLASSFCLHVFKKRDLRRRG